MLRCQWSLELRLTFSFQAMVNIAVLNYKRPGKSFALSSSLRFEHGFFLLESRQVLVWICQTKFVKLFTFLIHKLKICSTNCQSYKNVGKYYACFMNNAVLLSNFNYFYKFQASIFILFICLRDILMFVSAWAVVFAEFLPRWLWT